MINNIKFNGKLYKEGEPISQAEYESLKVRGEIKEDTYYLIKPNIDDKLEATKKWCSLSNAIIKKYKQMVEQDQEILAIRQLRSIRLLLEGNDFLKPEEFEDWGMY